MSITQVSIGHDGEQTSTELPTSGEVSRSTDWVGGGVTVQEGFGSRTIYVQGDLKDDHLVNVDGMQLQVRHARELGLLDALFEPSKMNRPFGEAAVSADQTPAVPEPGTYEEAEAAINQALEDGKLDYTEASETATALGQAALTGWGPQEALEVIDGLQNGNIEQSDLSANELQVASAVQTKIIDAQTASARTELGAEAFNHLSSLAASNPDVASALRGYGVQRATGRADATWSELNNDVLAHIEGR